MRFQNFKGGSSRSRSGLLRYSTPPSSEENTEYSVYDYCGDNYVIPPEGQHTSLSNTVDTQYSIREYQAKNFHRPLFITVVTLAQCVLLIYVCVAGGIEPISFKPNHESKNIAKFGFIASQDNGSKVVHKKEVFRDTGVNAFIGPNASLLVKVGAKFVPVGFIYCNYIFQCNTESFLVIFSGKTFATMSWR